MLRRERRREPVRGVAHGDLTPLVGRDEEIELLLRRWEQAKGGEGQVVLISGEPGIGKSRIAETVAGAARRRAAHAAALFLLAAPSGQRALPVIAQLERAAGFRRDDTAEQRLDKLEAVLAQATNDLGEAVRCSRICCRSRPATATRRSTSPRRSARRRRCRRCWRRSRDWRRGSRC